MGDLGKKSKPARRSVAQARPARRGRVQQCRGAKNDDESATGKLFQIKIFLALFQQLGVGKNIFEQNRLFIAVRQYGAEFDGIPADHELLHGGVLNRYLPGRNIFAFNISGSQVWNNLTRIICEIAERFRFVRFDRVGLRDRWAEEKNAFT
jgi:hypothetical protein